MTIVLIIAHAPLASSLKAVAEHAYPDAAVSLYALDVASDASAETVAAQARACIERCGDVAEAVHERSVEVEENRSAHGRLVTGRERWTEGSS